MLYEDFKEWMGDHGWVEALLWSRRTPVDFFATIVSPAGAVIDIHVKENTICAVTPVKAE